MCSSEFTFKWHLPASLKLKSLFFIFFIINTGLCSPTLNLANQNQSIPLNSFKTVGHKDCNKTFESPAIGPKKGHFNATVFKHEANLTQHSHSCVFNFIAQPNEQVLVSFSSFKLRSSPPDCKREFIEFYSGLNNTNSNLKNATLISRHCGQSLPKPKMSIKQDLALVYYSELNDFNETEPAFIGTYEFMKADPFTINSTSLDHECNFEILSSKTKDGTIQTPTYPGVYPQPINCIYKFKGLITERIKIEFHDFDLYFGGNHCPFDKIKIWDGENKSSLLINTYCGQKRSFSVFSSSNNLLMQFVTTKRINKAENRGFSAWFEFSENFVNLGFINKEDSQHIIGTECDQQIFSKGKDYSNYLISPNYPFNYPASSNCAYYLYGFSNQFILQKVKINFEKFDLPNINLNDCSEASLKVFTSNPPYDDPDYILCKSDYLPTSIISENTVMMLLFRSNNNLQVNGQGFKLQYIFETDYKIEGTQIPPGCNFIYKSLSSKTGMFNSPHYPANYPVNIDCIYEFIPLPNEQIIIKFQSFKLDKTENSLNNIQRCVNDWLEIIEIFPNNENQTSLDTIQDNSSNLMSEHFYKMQNFHSTPSVNNKIGRWCSSLIPGPVITSKPGLKLKFNFHSDFKNSASGFLASYQFRKPLRKCSQVFINNENNYKNKTKKSFGVLTNPNYPKPYKSKDELCDWFISVKHGNRLLLSFDFFSFEGNMNENGCSNAVLKIWLSNDSLPIELCGPKLSNEKLNFVSTDNTLRVSFFTTSKAIGAPGFKAFWTEIYPNEPCQSFKCKVNNYCIDFSLRCNTILNCGTNDNSDEINCN